MLRQLLFVSLLFSCSAAIAQQEYFREDFNGTAVPAGWTVETTGTDAGFLVGSAPALSSQYFPIPGNGTNIILTNDDACNCDKSAERLTFPALDLAGGSNIFLEMSVLNVGQQDNQGNKEFSEIQASVDGGATWEVVERIEDFRSVEFQTVRMDVSQYASADSVQFSLFYSDGGGWLFGAGFDWVRVFTPAAIAVSAEEIVGEEYILPSDFGDQDISVLVANNGTDVITTLDIDVTIDGQVTSVTIPNLSIQPFAESLVATGVGLGSTDIKSYSIETQVTSINGQADADMSDNSATSIITALSRLVSKPVVGEQATGTWCTFCPRGHVYMDIAEADDPAAFIAIAVHNDDPMAVTNYDAGLTSLDGFTGFPSVALNRTGFIDATDILDNMAQIQGAPVPFELAISSAVVDTNTNEVVASFDLTSVTNWTTDLRFAYVITEDSVTGTGPGYAQVNAYAGGGRGPMGGYENLPNPVPASQMVYEDVARVITPRFDGDVVGNQALTDEQVVSRMARIAIPASVNDRSELNFIAMVFSADGTLMNASEMEVVLPIASSVQELDFVGNAMVFPNPTSDVLQFTGELEQSELVTITLSNLAGQTVEVRQVSAKLINETFDVSALAAGAYQLTLSTKTGLRTYNVVVE